MQHHPEDPVSLDAIRDYFEELYWLRGADALDTKQVLRCFSERRKSLDFPFETIAEQFRLIETPLVPVIVPYQGAKGVDDTAKRLLEELRWAERPDGTARRLQPYVVQIPRDARAHLLATGAAESVRKDRLDHQFVALENLDLYRSDLGLTWHDPTYRRAEGLLF